MIRRQGVGPGHRAHAVCGLPGKKPNSPICREMLENELEKIRRLDVAYDNKKAGISLRCIALPIRNDAGLIIAGLSNSAQPRLDCSNQGHGERDFTCSGLSPATYVRVDWQKKATDRRGFFLNALAAVSLGDGHCPAPARLAETACAKPVCSAAYFPSSA